MGRQESPPQVNSFQPRGPDRPNPIWAREVVEVPLSSTGTGKIYLDLLGDHSVK